MLIATNDEPSYEYEPGPVLSTENHYVPPLTMPLPPEAPPPVNTPEKSTAFMDMMEAISLVLSARAILLLTLIGAFVLAASAMFNPTGMRLGILCAYCVLAVLPCVWLETRK